jgi:hypothetical protein
MSSRLTILKLMGAVSFIAVGMAALRANDEVWTFINFALTVSGLCTASVVAIYRRGAWAGFAVFGWAQFLICQPQSAPTVGPASIPVAIAYRLSSYVSTPTAFADPSFRIPGFPAIISDVHGKPYISSVVGGSTSGGGFVPIHSLRTVLCFSSIIVGFLGMIVGRFVAGSCRAGMDPE